MRNRVIGQTGSMLLSDDTRLLVKGKRRIVRYHYDKVKSGWLAWVCGPFHSRTYGACGFGTSKVRAKETLQNNLAHNYGYIGNLLFSDVDEGDNVGDIDNRLVADNAIAAPVTV